MEYFQTKDSETLGLVIYGYVSLKVLLPSLTYQVHHVSFQNSSQFAQHQQGRIPHASFDLTEVGSVYISAQGECFLRQPFLISQAPNDKLNVNVQPEGVLLKAARLKYSLAELVAQCDTSATSPADMASWGNVKPSGR